MLKQVARRCFAGLGVTGALLAASAMPASAAPPAQDLDLWAKDVVVAPGGPAKGTTLFALTAERGDYTVKVDRSKVASFAEVRDYGGDVCTESGAILTCKVLDKEDDGSYINMVELYVRAKDGAKPDQEGVLEYTVTGADSSSASFHSTVSIGEAADLAIAGEEVLELKGAPGTTFNTPLQVKNRGEKVAHGAVLFFAGSYGLSPSNRYENCEYGTGTFDDQAFACRFDTTIAPGGTARLDSSFGFTVPADSWAPKADFGFATWFTPADWEEYRSDVNIARLVWSKGTEGELKLESVATQRSKQTDVNPGDNDLLVRLQVTGDQRADVAALGSEVTGEVGATMPLKVGYVNNGPAAVGTRGRWVFDTLVTLPKGVTAVRVPQLCTEKPPRRPGEKFYGCFRHGRVGTGEKVEFEFELRVDKAGSHTGEVEVRLEDGIKDLNTANDTAKIMIGATADGGSNNPGGDDGQGGGDTGGSLPITGTNAGVIAGIGGALLAAGAAGFVVARRRKTRFIA